MKRKTNTKEKRFFIPNTQTNLNLGGKENATWFDIFEQRLTLVAGTEKGFDLRLLKKRQEILDLIEDVEVDEEVGFTQSQLTELKKVTENGWPTFNREILEFLSFLDTVEETSVDVSKSKEEEDGEDE